MVTVDLDAAAGPKVRAASHAEALDPVLVYERPRAFTWTWFLRRGWVFWPLAAAYGLFLALWHSSAMGKWQDLPPFGSRAVLAYLVAVSAGPLIATGVRGLRLRRRYEVPLVLAAVACGMMVAFTANDWSKSYHDYLMGHSHGGMPAPQAAETLSRAIGRLMGQLPGWLALFLVSGGLELPSYLTERRRLAEGQRKRDLWALRREKADADLRLAVLQAQIEPHFLFNTLASVRSLIRTDPEQAMVTIDALSDYLRSTLPKLRPGAGLESATVGEQVEIALGYLELMNLRMGGRLTIVDDVPAELRAAPFPPLLLISLVENAIKHGVEPKPGPGTITLRARRLGERLEVVVEDDGMGLSEGAEGGVGLTNIREQLRHRFGGRASLEIAGRPGGGVTARILAPVEGV